MYCPKKIKLMQYCMFSILQNLIIVAVHTISPPVYELISMAPNQTWSRLQISGCQNFSWTSYGTYKPKENLGLLDLFPWLFFLSKYAQITNINKNIGHCRHMSLCIKLNIGNHLALLSTSLSINLVFGPKSTESLDNLC